MSVTVAVALHIKQQDPSAGYLTLSGLLVGKKLEDRQEQNQLSESGLM